ncbi:MAG: type II toxin-antitoxin system VapC family toxin [Microbacterium sp.]
MPLVVDTSITLAWLFPDESNETADAVLERIAESDETMIAPALWIEETANAVVSAHRRGRLSDALVAQSVALLENLPVQIASQPSDRGALVAEALRSGLSAYDAAYLLLAERNGAALATLDGKLAAAARAAGVEVWPEAALTKRTAT